MSLSAATERETEARPIPLGGSSGGRFKVVIVGGGVAALEAVLALQAIAADAVDVELIAPNDSFSLQALSVAKPFEGGEAEAIDLAEFCERQNVELRRDSLAEIWGEQQRVLTASCEEVFYDALLLTVGVRRSGILPGAHAFRGYQDVEWLRGLLDEIEAGAKDRIVFALPKQVRWPLPLLELALLTSEWLRGRVSRPVSLSLVTAEQSPLEIFGRAPSRRIASLLGDAGIEQHPGHAPVRFEDGVLACEDGHGFEADEVIALPGLEVPEIPGLPQGRNGFVGCDPEMRVDGLRSVWVAGDASWFPIKQGGLAAQQAEVAAAGIAAAAGVDVDVQPFRPVIRAALLTGEEPQFLRTEPDEGAEAELSTSPLWWPPIKVAGPRLAPYLAREWAGDPGDPIGLTEDLTPTSEGNSEAEHRAALELSLDFADLDALQGDLKGALRWLEIAERLNVTLPADYVEKQRQWLQESAGTSAEE